MSKNGAPRRGFTPAEFEGRVARAQGIMAENNLDALLLTTPPNIRYVTGFDSQFWESPTRPWFVVVPAEGKPIAVIPEIGAPQMAETWLDDVRHWPAPVPEDDGISLLAETLSDVTQRHGRVGAELGREMSLRMPVIEFMALRDRLPRIDIVDGSPVIWRIRMTKSTAEIAHHRYICELVSDAFEALTAKLGPGMTEREACRILREDAGLRGADATPFMPGVSGPGGQSQIVCGPSDRELQLGDVLFIDTGCTYDGYFCDFDRLYAIGDISDAAKRAHDTVWLASEAGIAAARPGATPEDLWRAMSKVLEDAGSLGNNVGRLGHGLGLQLTEPPSNMPGDATVIEAGMVLTIEPGMEFEPGRMLVHEENIVITEDGAEMLTKRAPREMWRVG